VTCNGGITVLTRSSPSIPHHRTNNLKIWCESCSCNMVSPVVFLTQPLMFPTPPCHCHSCLREAESSLATFIKVLRCVHEFFSRSWFCFCVRL